MSLGTPAFTANGFASGSVNRPWHRSRPAAAARPWIMHGGEFKKMISGFEGASVELRFWRKSEADPSRFSRAAKYFCSAPFFKALPSQSGLCNMPPRVVLSTNYSWLYLHWCVRALGSHSRLETWTSRAFFFFFFNPLCVFVTQLFCSSSPALIRFVRRI